MTSANREQPSVFVSHGSPMTALETGPYALALAEFGKSVAPGSILVVSAHWQEPSFCVTSGPSPALIYDYYGFPASTYELRYPAPGEPELAARLCSLLQQAQLPAQAIASRGFDHGMFIPLMLMFPEADIPVVQLSLRNSLDPDVHLQAGKALAPLRDEGILIIGSGMSFHNMHGYGDPRFSPVSDQFDGWLTSAVEADAEQRRQLLIDWAQAPSARLSHPPGAEEHLLPLMVVAGAAGADSGRRSFSDRVMETTLSAYSFG